MNRFTLKIGFLLSLALFANSSFVESVPINKSDTPKIADSSHKGKVARITIVGDTGTGERAYPPGFKAVQKAMRNTRPDALLHLGDFVYQPEPFPDSCPNRYIEEIKNNLVTPYPLRLFVAGDNDLPPKKNKPTASGCWYKIDPLDSGFDAPIKNTPQPRDFEGTRVVGNALIGVILSFPWQDPTEWLKPRIEKARE